MTFNEFSNGFLDWHPDDRTVRYESTIDEEFAAKHGLDNVGGYLLPKLYVRKPGDVGHDLTAYIEQRGLADRIASVLVGRKALIVWPFSRRAIASGIRLELPNTLWCEVRARSSTASRNLAVIGGTIDSGYRGELFTVLYNFGLIPRVLIEGERYSQVVFHEAIRPAMLRVHAITSATERGSSGFGSTGR